MSLSQKSLAVLVEHGCDLFQQDLYVGYNILHSLIAAASFDPSMESELCKLYKGINELIPTSRMKSLLHTENKQGFRPVEFAGKEGTFELFWTMYQTEGVYLARHEVRGGRDYKWYNITEYEPRRQQGNRWLKTPLMSLLRIDEQVLLKPSAQRFLKSQMLGKWIQAKRSTNYMTMIIMFSCRIISIALFFWFQQLGPEDQLLEDDVSLNGTQLLNDFASMNGSCHRNSSNRAAERSKHFHLQIFLQTYSALTLLVTVIFFLYSIKFCHRWLLDYNLKGKKKLVLDQDAYHWSAFLFHVLVVAGAPYMHQENSTASKALNVLVSFQCGFYFMYMLQMFPHVGHFVVMMQAMMFTGYEFFIVFFIMCIPWLFLFRCLILLGKL